MSLDEKYLLEYDQIIGCDEVGRGPIAGPVVGCGVTIKSENRNLIQLFESLGIGDSKKLTTKKRLKILGELNIDLEKLEVGKNYEFSYQGLPFQFFLAEHSPAEIDQINILQASLSCMKNAALSLVDESSCIVLVDGNKGFEFDRKVEPIIKGDSKFICISLASIIAKEYRDKLMGEYDLLYPGYGLAKHAGYPTAAHKGAVAELGITPIHRKSFKGVKEHL